MNPGAAIYPCSWGSFSRATSPVYTAPPIYKGQSLGLMLDFLLGMGSALFATKVLWQLLLETVYVGKDRSFEKSSDPSRFWTQISAETGTAAAFLILLLNL